MPRKALLLSVDLEDWHQLLRRRLGVQDWERPGPALERQVQSALELLDSLGARATFFVLGMVARDHGPLVAEIARRGHEIACHGHAHLPVRDQRPQEFAEDLRIAREEIGEACGRVPAGYRAPAFSITGPACSWAYPLLAAAGFSYDSSQHESPLVRGPTTREAAGPHLIDLPDGQRLWELPVAVWRVRGMALPVGGASYWSLMPLPLVLHGLECAPEHPGLYLHPHELDSEPLRLGLARGAGMGRRARAAVRTLRREAARRRARPTLSAIAERFDLIPYGSLHAILDQPQRAGTPPLP